eukprot:278567-Karenia_brevis.AAC.2
MEVTWNVWGTHMESMWIVYGLICNPYGIHVECLCTPVESTWHPQAVHKEAYEMSMASIWNVYGLIVRSHANHGLQMVSYGIQMGFIRMQKQIKKECI